MDREFHNKIAELCLSHFQTLPKTGKPTVNEWTVLSCIVKQQDQDFEVVSLGTGSKCIGRNKMCPRGTVLNDSHAEIICRRSFLRYLYDQMTSTGSIFEFRSDISKFKLKPSVKFHFFTTRVPCGDAAIFPKQLVEEFGDILCDPDDIVPNKKRKIDIFRTGAKCVQNGCKQDPKLEGVGYHVLGVVRTKPGRGDPTLSVSCSDKMAKWCHLGVQGALISILLESPIYLDSFTIAGGTDFSHEALERALWGRFKNANVPYWAVIVGKADILFSHGKMETKTPCPSSISWTNIHNAERALEVSVNGKKQGVTKKNLNKDEGRLKICRRELFGKFLDIVKSFNIKLAENVDCVTYENAKSAAADYQTRWSHLKVAFNSWPKKDKSFQQFCIN